VVAYNLVMGASVSLSVEEYRRTVYRPDCDYVDGLIVERNVGEKDHAKVQRALLLYLHSRRTQWDIVVLQEQRIQVSPTRFRVPDTCVLVGPEPDEQVFTQPPFLCVEVLSPEDRLGRMQDRIADYLSFGVPYVWLIDPQARRAWIYTADRISEVRDGTLRTQDPDIEMPLAEIFE
jgi:Uma2 family endonuclease